MSFRVGDRVAVTVDRPDGNPNIHAGSQGTVCQVTMEPGRVKSVGVAFDHKVDGHWCSNNCKLGYGWYMRPNQVILVQDDESEVDDQTVADFSSELIGVLAGCGT